MHHRGSNPEISMSIRPPGADFPLLRPLADLRPPSPDLKPDVTIKPAYSSIKEECGALNLSARSGSAVKSEGGWSPPPSSGSPGSPGRSPPPSQGGYKAPRSPQGYRPPTYTSLEICVVCGDRASGKKKGFLYVRFPSYIQGDQYLVKSD